MDLTSAQLPYSDDLLGLGTGLDCSARNWTLLQDLSAIDFGESILPNPSNFHARRHLDLEPGLGCGDLFLIDTSHTETRWWDFIYAMDLITVAEIGSNNRFPGPLSSRRC